MSEITQPRFIGITAHAASASTQDTSGASRNTPLLEPDGMIGSFSTNLRKSAKDCSRPNGPTTLGPLRICTPAQILRSAHSRKARETITPTTTNNVSPVVIRVQPPGVAQKDVEVACTGYSAATRPPRRAAARAEHSAMVTLARAIGLVW